MVGVCIFFRNKPVIVSEDNFTIITGLEVGSPTSGVIYW